MDLYRLNELSNDNGFQISKLAASNDLRRKSVMFPQNNIYKYTWVSHHWHTITQNFVGREN